MCSWIDAIERVAHAPPLVDHENGSKDAASALSIGLALLPDAILSRDFSIGIRNANDKSMRLALTVGYRVFVCDNMAFNGDFTPLLI